MGVEEAGYCVHALSVMPDHVHAAVPRHEHRHERIVGDLKANASRRVRRALNADAHLSIADPKERRRQRVPIWSQRFWVRFLNDDEAIRNAIRYVERNPTQAGLRPQRWSFITPF
jgi:REP element-mobilizing transposase RayT